MKEVLKFIDQDLEKNRELIASLTREDYIEYLEEDYYRRKQIESEKLYKT